MNIVGILEYGVFGLLLPLLHTVGFVVFIWGAFQYFIAGGHDEESKEKSKSLMMYGLILFVIMLCLWGLLRALFASFT